ncbi:hypothetical protein LZ31DRAFT_325499 [Colletotrichum somersetense]|nr:hypothetical protein LZ31DRAFT_325499 [Colletotrichum somersetense]
MVSCAFETSIMNRRADRSLSFSPVMPLSVEPNRWQGQVIPEETKSVGYQFYFLFAMRNITHDIFWISLPETAGRSLVELNKLFISKC